LDADGLIAGPLTYACAMTAEERAAKRLGRTALVGLGVANGVPPGGRLVSFGIAGALRAGLAVGTLIDATRVVDEHGAVLWEGAGLGVLSARRGTILGADRIVDDPAERAALHASTGADAVDMESATLARSGRLAGCIRAISDTPDLKLAGLAEGAKLDGRVDLRGLLRGFARSPVETTRAALAAARALRRLQRVVFA
jgi:adenosylhomocysteine nucleosidase